jgi:hypothetical protein
MGGVEGKQGAWAYPEGGFLIFYLVTLNLFTRNILKYPLKL